MILSVDKEIKQLMKPFSTLVHSILDYAAAVFLILSPWLFGFADGGARQWVPVIIGGFTILLSLLTRYEGGVVKLINMPAHLIVHAASGLLLAASPWWFSFADAGYRPHLFTGVLVMLVVVLSGTRPPSINSRRRR
jgi:hypothetical protein